MMRSCQENLEILSAWIDGEAEPGEIERLEEHLGHCASCARARAEMTGLSDTLRADASDYLDLSTPALVSSILVDKRGPGPWRYHLNSKLLPTLGMGVWCWLLWRHPEAFWSWPLLAVAAFALGFSRPGRAKTESLRPWFEGSLRPLGWGLSMLPLLPMTALLNAPQLESALLSGPLEIAGVGLVVLICAVAGVLLGMLRSLNPERWARARQAPWIFGLLSAGGAAVNGSLHGLIPAGLAGGGAMLLWCLWQLQQALSEREIGGESVSALIPRYPLGVLLVDLSLIWVPVAGNFVRGRSGDDLTAIFPSGSLWPVAVWLWWVLMRLPLASLVEWSQGKRVRWPLFLALSAMAITGGALYDKTFSLFFTVLGAALALLLAASSRRPATPDRLAMLGQRLKSWPVLPLLLLTLGLTFWNLPGTGEVEAAARLRRMVPPSPTPQYRGPVPFIEDELNRGLDAELPEEISPQLVSTKLGPKLLSYCEDNLVNIDRFLAADTVVNNLYYSDTNAREIGKLLLLRSLVSFEAGRNDEGVEHCVKLALWYRRWMHPQKVSFRYLSDLRGILLKYRLSAPQYERLLATLPHQDDDQQFLTARVDADYARLCAEELKAVEDGKLHLPAWKLASHFKTFSTAYLRVRERPAPRDADALEGSDEPLVQQLHSGLRDSRAAVSDLNLTLALLGLKLYRAETGRYPASLEAVETRLGKKLTNYDRNDGKFTYDGRWLAVYGYHNAYEL